MNDGPPDRPPPWIGSVQPPDGGRAAPVPATTTSPPSPPPPQPPTRRSRREAGRGGAGPHRADADQFVPGRLVRARQPARGTPGAVPPSTVGRVLTWVVLGVTVVHVVALALLWPRGTAPVAAGTRTALQGVTYGKGEVLRITTRTCPGTTDTRNPDGSIPATTSCQDAAVRLATGPDAGEDVSVSLPPGVARAGLAAGDEVQIVRYPPTDGQPAVYAFNDYSRETPLGLLTVVLVALVVLVARAKGVMAVVGLGLALATIGWFVLPALHRGENAALVSAVGAGSIMIVVLYASHGFSTKTTTALLGTLAGIWVTTGLAAWATSAAHLNGLGTEENSTLSRLTTGGSLSGFVLAGVVLAGLGVLNDVTITQASAVWELRRNAPHLGIGDLFTSGMRIGRDHLASTIYTIAFAYAGVALPTLLLVSLYGTPLRQLVNSSQLAEEITRTLTASIGLVLAIPLTTIIAAALAHLSTPAEAEALAGHGHGH